MIRNVSPATLRALKRLARSHRRSLEGEVRVILGRAIELAPADDNASALELETVKTRGSTSWSREELYSDDGR